MPVYQAYNKRSKSWVKYEFTKEKGFHALDVKQTNQGKPFKGIPVRGKKK